MTNQDYTDKILALMVTICSIKIGRNISIDELDELYATNPACALEIDYILGK